MSLAEEMLATMPLSDDSSTYSADEEPHIVINESRQAIVPNELKTIAVTGDKDIETVTFDCVRYWDGNDLSTFAIYLNYVLPDLTTGTYIPEKITTTDGDEFYHFDWHIKNNITAKSGKISFAVTAISTKPNWAGNPIVDKQWSSLPNSDCSIALGIEVSNVPSEEESSAVLAQMSAILEQIQADFDEWLENGVVQTTGDSTTAVMSQRATTEEFDMLKARLKLYDDAYGIIATGLENTYYIAMRNSKQIDNLKSGISDQFETDSSIAYVKDVPSNAMPYAEVKKIGGMTYKDGDTLRSAKVTEVKSVGANLCKYDKTGSTVQGGVRFTFNTDKTITANGTSTEAIYFRIGAIDAESGQTYTVSGVPMGEPTGVSLACQHRAQETNKKTSYDTGSGVTFTLADGCDNINLIIDISKGVTLSNLIFKPMIIKGATALPYTPYQEHTLPIPAEVQALDGYGWGVNADFYNYIDWEKKQFVQMVKKYIFTGNETVSIVRTRDDFCVFRVDCNITSIPLFADGITIICDFADAIPNTLGVTNMVSAQIKYYGAKSPWFDISLPVFTEKEALSLIAGQQMLYAIESPEITDISYLITTDNMLGVEGNGTITFENEYGYAVPSEVEYQVEV